MTGWVGRGGYAALVLAALALGRVITEQVPTATVDDKPFVHHATVGQVVHLRFGDVRVEDVRSARMLLTISNIVAPHGFLIVDLTYTARTRDGKRVSGLDLVDTDGRLHAPVNRDTACQGSAASSSGFIAAAVGVPDHVMVCYEVTEKALPGIRLRFAAGSPHLDGQENARDDLADIDLGIDKARAHAIATSRETFRYESDSMYPYPTGPCLPVPGKPDTVRCPKGSAP